MFGRRSHPAAGPTKQRLWLCVGALGLTLGTVASLPAQKTDQPADNAPASSSNDNNLNPGAWSSGPPAGVGVDEQLDENIPTDLPFVADSGEKVRLGEYFQSDKPVVLVMNYYQCPMMCGVILSTTVDALAETDLAAGDDYQLVAVSFDPSETPALAAQNAIGYRQRYSDSGGAGDPEAGFDFLVGQPDRIEALAESIGYRYRWSDEADQYLHPAAIVVLTPEGKISQYFLDMDWQYKPEQRLRGALVNASDGRIGSVTEKVALMFCNYHPKDGTYSASAYKIMRIGAPILGIGLVFGIVRFSMRKARSGTAAQQTGAA